MCTTDAKFLEKPIPEVVGWKVLERRGQGLYSPNFDHTNPLPWKRRLQAAVPNPYYPSDPMAGFHIFKSWISAWIYKSISRNWEVHKVRGYDVRAMGRVSGGWLSIYIAQEAELLK